MKTLFDLATNVHLPYVSRSKSDKPILTAESEATFELKLNNEAKENTRMPVFDHLGSKENSSHVSIFKRLGNSAI